jgi:CRP-like cAMP-binding protein
MTRELSAEHFKMLQNTVGTFVDISDSQWSKIYPFIHTKSFEKNDILIQVDDTPETMAFIISGIFRVFYTNEKGMEKTLIFRTANQFISAYSSFLVSQKSQYTIQAVIKSTIIYIPLAVYVELASNHECWKILSGRYIESLFIEKEQRERDLLMLDAASRYLNFTITFSAIIDSIPNYMIASYIGITPEALSRIIRRKLGFAHE